MGYGMAGDGLRARYAPASGGLYYLFQWDPQGSLVQRQTGGTGGAANTSYYALDTAMFDGYGAKLGDTDAFTGGAEATRDAMGFQGQFGAYTDNETGLVLMGHRYYDAGTGRFLTRDPLGYGGGINLYGFTGNNPVNEMDPDGTQESADDYKSDAKDDTPETTAERDDRIERSMPNSLSPNEQRNEEEAREARRVLNPVNRRATNDLIRQLNRNLIARMRSVAGFKNTGKPYLIDENVYNSLPVDEREGFINDLRAAGYNARSVKEVFGRDPGDDVLKIFAEQTETEVVSKDKGKDIGGGFGRTANKAVSIGLRRLPQQNNTARLLKYLKGVLPK